MNKKTTRGLEEMTQSLSSTIFTHERHEDVIDEVRARINLLIYIFD